MAQRHISARQQPFLQGRIRAFCGNNRVALCFRFEVFIKEQQGSLHLAHVTFDIVSEHAQKDIRRNHVSQSVVNGTNLEIDRLEPHR
jgi:hypothetical protein